MNEKDIDEVMTAFGEPMSEGEVVKAMTDNLDETIKDIARMQNPLAGLASLFELETKKIRRQLEMDHRDAEDQQSQDWWAQQDQDEDFSCQ